MAVQMSELGQESALSKDLSWLELALSPKDPDERKHFVYVDEMNGKRIMVATNRDRLHICAKFGMCFPLGYIPRESMDWFAPDEPYYRYQPALKSCNGTKFTFASELLIKTLQRFVKEMGSGNKELIIRFDPNRATLSGNSVLKGYTNIQIPCSTTVRPELMRVDAKYMLDAVTGCEAKTITMQQSVEPNGSLAVYPGGERVAIIKLREVGFR